MATTQKTTKAKDAFIEYLHTCNMRVTSERLSIIEVISKHTGLFSIEELHNLMIREAFPVSTATLYNTIDLLIDAGLVKSVRFADRQTALFRLELNDKSHVYLVCERCGTVKESSAKALTRHIGQHGFTGFENRSFALTVYGLCSKCKRMKN